MKILHEHSIKTFRLDSGYDGMDALRKLGGLFMMIEMIDRLKGLIPALLRVFLHDYRSQLPSLDIQTIGQIVTS